MQPPRADGLIIGAVALLGLLAGCSSNPTGDGAPKHPDDLSDVPDAIPRVEPFSRYGNPSYYEVFGKRYYTLRSNKGFVERGIASWYGTKFHGKRTSSGEPYDMYTMSAAHKTLPLPTYAKVTNLQTGRSIVVRINDRGPFHDNRVIDLSFAAATKLGIMGRGTGLVEVRALDPRRPEPAARLPPGPDPSGSDPSRPSLYVQVGAFGSQYNANKLRSSLQHALDGAIRIQSTAVSGKSVYRVQVGPLASVQNADALSERLTQLGYYDLHVIVE